MDETTMADQLKAKVDFPLDVRRLALEVLAKEIAVLGTESHSQERKQEARFNIQTVGELLLRLQ